MDEQQQAAYAADLDSAFARGRDSRQGEVNLYKAAAETAMGEAFAQQVIADALLEHATRDGRAAAALKLQTALLNVPPALASLSAKRLKETIETRLAELAVPPAPPEISGHTH